MDLKQTAGNYFSDLKEIPAAGLILSEEVRNLCKQNTCGSYGKNWTCPPAVDSLDVFRERFATFDSMLIVYRVYPVKGSFDWKGMMAAANEFKERFQAMKKEIEASVPDGNFLFLGAGGCHLCSPCAYVEGEPCRNPGDAVISLEACGIDVMRLMKDHGMKYYNGINTVTFIGGILFNNDGS
jgi:predicted metal-binding protein